MAITESQRVALECVRDFGGNNDGWSDIELQFISRRTTNEFPTRLESALCYRVFQALKRKGLVEQREDGWHLTDAGCLELESESVREDWDELNAAAEDRADEADQGV